MQLKTRFRRLAPFAALCLLLAVGAGLGQVYEMQKGSRDAMSSAVLQRLTTAQINAIAQAALLVLLWLSLQLLRKAALFGAFLLVESNLQGRPANQKSFRFAVMVQSTMALLFALGGTALMLFPALRAMPEPLINIGQHQVDAILGPAAPIAMALAALFTYDLVGYWVHRAQHRYPFLWRFHAIHHSIEDLDSLNSFTHPIDTFVVLAGMAAVAVTIGFSFQTFAWFLAFQMIHDLMLHTRAPVNFGLLGVLLVDNRTHFLHHTRIRSRSGQNFAATFTILDRIFGTYERPDSGSLEATGIEGEKPPATLGDFFLARTASPVPASHDQVRPAIPATGFVPPA